MTLIDSETKREYNKRYREKKKQEQEEKKKAQPMFIDSDSDSNASSEADIPKVEIKKVSAVEKSNEKPVKKHTEKRNEKPVKKIKRAIKKKPIEIVELDDEENDADESEGDNLVMDYDAFEKMIDQKAEEKARFFLQKSIDNKTTIQPQTPLQPQQPSAMMGLVKSMGKMTLETLAIPIILKVGMSFLGSSRPSLGQHMTMQQNTPFTPQSQPSQHTPTPISNGIIF